jgi:DNA polymerase-1
MEYKLPQPFSLEKHEKVYLDIETTGLEMYNGDTVIGVSVGVEVSPTESHMRYFPVGHRQGPNLPKSAVYQWLRKELKGKTITGHNIGGFDLPFLRHEGLNLIPDNTFSDTMHAAILDNPTAPGYSLDRVAKRYLGDEYGKVQGLDKEKLADYHPAEVGSYAEQDTRLCWMLEPVLYGHLRKRELLRVFELECQTIRPVVEMQANGLRFDYTKAKAWIDLAQTDLKEVESGLAGLNYNSGKQIQPKCDELGIIYPWNWSCPNPECEEAFPSYKQDKPFICWKCKLEMKAGSPHFGKKFLSKIDHPFVKTVRKARQLHKLLHTFLIPWVENIDPTNPILRYTLNQLRERDEQGGSTGAVSGRFSCAGMGSGAQPQQIWATENQIAEIGDSYLLRSLFIPEEGKQFMSLDASQIEFRLFAHYSENAELIREYNENPKVDFHQLVAEKVLRGLLPRKKAKNVNFGTLYNMGVPKFAREMNVSIKEAQEMFDTYNQYFPAAKELRDKEKRKAQVGSPTLTLLGRRFDWLDPAMRKKCYVALNRLIQGSAADIMKLALVKCYNGNYLDCMRLTVHDEVDGDISRLEQAQDLKHDLEDPKFLDGVLKVPLIWEETIGKSWSGR